MHSEKYISSFFISIMTLSHIIYIHQKLKVNFIKSMYFFYFLLSLFLISCVSLKKEDNIEQKSIPVNKQDMSLFEKAFKDLGNKQYSLVIPIFEKLAKKYRGQDLEWASLYNLASAYKELNQCKKAESTYQQLIPKVEQYRHLKSRIYLSLSYVYECLGQPENTLITLKEGINYITSDSTEDIRLIEYPARLALAYIRMNEDKRGLDIQKTVYANMEVIKKTFRIGTAADHSFSRYFYIIGRSHIHPSSIQLHSFLKMFFYYQTYLMQSILLNAGNWSHESKKELENIYNKMWIALNKQKNKKTYIPTIKKILNELKSIAYSSKNEKILVLYSRLKVKTLFHLEKLKK